jgi:hypothetical protein
MTRETVYAALFAKISGLSGIKTASRRLRHWTDVSSAEQPAAFLAQISESPEQSRGMPTKWKLKANIYLYCNSGSDPNASPSTELNGLIDAIEAALVADYTLGGLCSHCWITDDIETDEGVLGGQAVAIIPVEILPF